LEETMLKRGIAWVTPVAVIVAASACGGTPSSTAGEEETGQASSADKPGGAHGGDFHGDGDRDHHGGVHHGWFGGRWVPGNWGWANGQWVVGGGVQYTCVVDDDCVGPLGPGVAVCSYDPMVALGYCIAPNW
jgi:hypothetical protein